MRKINGKYYRKFKSTLGRVYWIEMSMDEVMAQDLYRGLLVLTPLVMIGIFALAAGLI